MANAKPALSKKIRMKPIAASAESPLQKGWPPAWAVSFSDLTTLLMTAFVLWYSNKAMYLPAELLRIDKDKGLSMEEAQSFRDNATFEVAQKVISTIHNIAPEKEESVINELVSAKEMGEEISNYINQTGLSKDADVQNQIGEVLVTLSSATLFPEGESELKPEALGILDKVAGFLKSRANYQLTIEGHSDNKPINPLKRIKFDSNWELSYYRALSVANYFMSKGTPTSLIGIMGYGEQKPKIPNDSEENRAKNRRVEIRITFSKEK